MSTRDGQEMYTVGLVSSPAPHNANTPSPSNTGIPTTFTTTPKDHLDYTLSQISPGLAVANLLRSPSSCSTTTESKFKDSSTSLNNCANSPSITTSNVSVEAATSEPVKMLRYESVFPRYTSTMGFINRFGASHPSSYSRTTTATTTTSVGTQVYTITPSSYSPYRSAFTSIGNRNTNLVTSRANPSSLSPNIIKTTAVSYQYPSPSWPTRVKLDSGEGYDNLQFEMGERDNDRPFPPPPDEARKQLYPSKPGTSKHSPSSKGNGYS